MQAYYALCAFSQQADEGDATWHLVYLYADVICLYVYRSSSLLVQQGDYLD
jgi:hypothetical protein